MLLTFSANGANLSSEHWFWVFDIILLWQKINEFPKQPIFLFSEKAFSSVSNLLAKIASTANVADVC